MRALGFIDFSQYHDYVRANPHELKKLEDVLTINLSYFFRNPETFEYIKEQCLTTMRSCRRLVFWSAGCSHGEEPYSLAIIAAEAGLLKKTTIYGTDIDASVLKDAEKGIYTQTAVQYVQDHRLQEYFNHTTDGYTIKDELKSHTQFLRVDIMERPAFGLCDLIMCRNVLIYLDRKTQSIVLKNFYDQLTSWGYLVIGKVELLLGMPEAALFKIINRSEHVYQKCET
jgi:chemotaxis protein methyltransferase CheR